MWRAGASRQAINFGHPSAQGLVFAYMGGDRELLSGSPLLTKTTSTGLAYIGPSPNFRGHTAFHTNTTSAYTGGGFDPDATGPGGQSMRVLLQTITTQHTLMWIGSLRSKVDNSYLFGIPSIDAGGGTTKTGASTFDGHVLSANIGASATSYRMTSFYRVVTNGPQSTYNTPPYDPYASGNRRAIAWYRNAAAGGVVNNGLRDYSASAYYAPALNWTAGGATLFGWPSLHTVDYHSTSYGTVNGATDAVLIWNRQLSYQEIVELQRNPHQLLERTRYPIALIASAGSVALGPDSFAGASTSTAALSIAIPLASSVAGTSSSSSLLDSGMASTGVGTSSSSSDLSMSYAVTATAAGAAASTANLGVNYAIHSRNRPVAEFWAAGDSITAVTGGSIIWAYKLTNTLKTAKIDQNTAVNGAGFVYSYSGSPTFSKTITQFIDDFQPGGGSAFGATWPTTYIVAAGTNDFIYKPGSEASMITAVKAAIIALKAKLTAQTPSCRVIWMTPMPLNHGLGYSTDASRQIMRQFYFDTFDAGDVIDVEALAEPSGVNKGDWLPAYYNDGIHPNGAGHDALAQIVSDFLDVGGRSASTSLLNAGVYSTVAGSSTGTGDLSVAIALASSVTATSSSTGALSGPITLVSSVAGTSSSSSDLSAGTQVPLASVVAGVSSLPSLPALTLYRYLMPSTLAELRAMLRARLNEAAAVAWSDTDLDMWLNEGARETVRRTLCIEDEFTFPAVAGVQSYTPPNLADCIMVNRVQYNRSGSTEVFPVEYADFNNLDQVWWTAQVQTQSVPEYFTMWGMYPSLKIVVYPTPADAGTFKVYYWRLCQLMISDSDYLELPMGWHDLAVDYAFYLALLRDRDQRWQEPLARFEQRLQRLTELTTRHTPHGGGIDAYSGGGNSPGWLTGGAW